MTTKAIPTPPAEPLQTSAPIATPENTPVPGGGRWLWDGGIGNWVELTELQDKTPEPTLSTTFQPE